jgi:MarR family 2-MHQ and catechol resistance regulon transcriptional repressor
LAERVAFVSILNGFALNVMPPHYSGTPAEITALDAFIKLKRAVDTLDREIARNIEATGLTESQFGVLEALLHLGPQCQRVLGEKILKSGGNITMVVDNLEKAGYVERRPCIGDRRRNEVHLTSAGEHLIAAIFPRHVQAICTAFAPLSARQQRQLAALCRKLGLGLRRAQELKS